MQTAKIFVNGRSQSVRLPKDFRLPGSVFSLKKSEISLSLSPKMIPGHPC